MNQKFCDICGAEEDYSKNFYITGFRHKPDGIKEACPNCHNMLNRNSDKLEAYFKKQKTEMLKELAVRMKKNLTSRST